MGYLVIKNGNNKKSYQCTNTCNKPRLRVGNSYVPITNSTKPIMRARVSGSYIADYKSYTYTASKGTVTTGTTYLTGSTSKQTYSQVNYNTTVLGGTTSSSGTYISYTGIYNFYHNNYDTYPGATNYASCTMCVYATTTHMNSAYYTVTCYGNGQYTTTSTIVIPSTTSYASGLSSTYQARSGTGGNGWVSTWTISSTYTISELTSWEVKSTVTSTFFSATSGGPSGVYGVTKTKTNTIFDIKKYMTWINSSTNTCYLTNTVQTSSNSYYSISTSTITGTSYGTKTTNKTLTSSSWG